MAKISTGSTSAAVADVFSHTIKLVQNDTLPELNMILRDSSTAAADQVLSATDSTTWAPIDLTDVSVSLKFKALGSSTVKDTITMIKHAPHTEGRVFMQWPVGTLDTAGIFIGEVELTYSGGDIQTLFDQLKFKVRGDY